MAWTEELASGKFRGRYRNADGKIRSAGVFAQKKQAEREAARKESEQREPGAVNLDGGKIRWGAWFEQWHDSRIVSFATDTTYRSTADNHILPYWKDTRLDEVDSLGVARWVKQLQKNGASPYTIRNAFGLFKTTLKAAVDGNRLVRNPADGVRTPDVPQATERYLTHDEVDRIAFYLNGVNATILRVAVGTGLRFGEIAGLHWHRVDLERGMLHVVEKYDQKAHVIDPVPKDKEKRSVPLTDELVRLLARHREVSTPGATCGLPHQSGRCGGDLVFRGPRGAQLKSSDWGRKTGPFHVALELAGITDRVRVHDLRHTYASWLIQAGVPMPEIARVMGHSDNEVLRRYAHLSDDGYEKVRAALSNIDGRRQRPDAARSVADAVRQHAEHDDADERGADDEPRGARRAPQSPRGAERGAKRRHTGLYLVTGDDDENAG